MRILLILLVFTPCILIAQIAAPKKAEACWEKGKSRENKRYAEWECGKVAGIVDCNEKLEIDPATNTVLTNTQHQPFSGTCETCHGNGTLERRVTFVNGKTNGADTTTYPSGCPKVMRNHVMGEENGTWYYYYDSTGYQGKERLSWEMNYSVGELHGKQVYFNLNGDTTKFENYNMGVLNGPKVTYYKGKRSRVANYAKGVLDGPYLVYNKEGKIIEDLSYKEGKKNGVLKYYYDDGTLLRTENWNMDVRNGEFKTLYYEQFVQTVENYRKGQKEGWFEEYFPDQKPKRRALYKKNELIEEHVWNEAGQEIKTFGGEASKGNEDDAMPGTTSKKKKGKKNKASESEQK